VEDTGIGIPADEVARLFQEFQQLPNSRKAGQGTGLGLALTRHIVEAQGGTVAVRSTPGAQVACFLRYSNYIIVRQG
jgi:signal transduction histidine kinase